MGPVGDFLEYQVKRILEQNSWDSTNGWMIYSRQPGQPGNRQGRNEKTCGIHDDDDDDDDDLIVFFVCSFLTTLFFYAQKFTCFHLIYSHGF